MRLLVCGEVNLSPTVPLQYQRDVEDCRFGALRWEPTGRYVAVRRTLGGIHPVWCLDMGFAERSTLSAPRNEATLSCILIIDDDQPARLAVRRLLQSAGHEVLEAFDGVDAMPMLGRQPVDLVIVDLQMPRMGGVEFIQELKGSSPATAVVVLSAHVGEAISVLGQMGVSNVFVKPLRMKEFLDTVDHLLRGSGEGGSLKA